jgi:hypothetical protein
MQSHLSEEEETGSGMFWTGVAVRYGDQPVADIPRTRGCRIQGYPRHGEQEYVPKRPLMHSTPRSLPYRRFVARRTRLDPNNA